MGETIATPVQFLDYNEDILNAPDAKGPATVVQEFEVGGQKRSLEFRADGLTNAETYFLLLSTIQKYGDQSEDFSFEVQPPKGPAFTVSDSQYIGTLVILEKMVVQPKMMVDEWAQFGRKHGGPLVNVISGFALAINGITTQTIAAKKAKGKKGETNPTSDTKSPKLASSSSRKRPAKGPSVE